MSKTRARGCLGRKDISRLLVYDHGISPSMTPEVNKHLSWFIDEIKLALLNRYDIKFIGFGKFQTHHWPAKRGISPPHRGKKQYPIMIPARDVPEFKPGLTFKNEIRKARKNKKFTNKTISKDKKSRKEK